VPRGAAAGRAFAISVSNDFQAGAGKPSAVRAPSTRAPPSGEAEQDEDVFQGGVAMGSISAERGARISENVGSTGN